MKPTDFWPLKVQKKSKERAHGAADGLIPDKYIYIYKYINIYTKMLDVPG